MQSEAERIAAGLSEAMKNAIGRARREWSTQPPRCYAHSRTMTGLRNHGLAHGDCCYLTPLGLAVRQALNDTPG